MASKISNSRLDLVINAEPQPRLHTKSIGQAEFRSCKKEERKEGKMVQNEIRMAQYRTCFAVKVKLTTKSD